MYKDSLKKLPDNFCSRPWTDMHIFEDGNITPCCVLQEFAFFKGNIKDYFTESENLKNLKKSFLNNEKHPACQSCWISEDAGLKPHKKISKIREIHIRVSNKCNFKCRMCSSKFSSAIQAEAVKFNIHHTNYKLLDTLPFIKVEEDLSFLLDRLRSCKTLSFSGGEPFISNAHLKLLVLLYRNKLFNLQLSYNTNLSTLKYKGINLLKLLDNFKHVTISVSCDGYGKSAEYSRKGLIWDRFDNNLKNLIEHTKNKNYTINLFNTINIYSIYSLPELCEYADRLGLEIKLNPCYQPIMHCPQILPIEEKILLHQKYEKVSKNLSLYHQNILKDAYNFVSSKDYTKQQSQFIRKSFFNYNNMLDSYRKENFVETNPELKNWYEWNYE
jgi:radical SAM protein with 4Fe4S-binding SPASM domain